jgi:hypothetical protein
VWDIRKRLDEVTEPLSTCRKDDAAKWRPNLKSRKHRWAFLLAVSASSTACMDEHARNEVDLPFEGQLLAVEDFKTDKRCWGGLGTIEDLDTPLNGVLIIDRRGSFAFAEITTAKCTDHQDAIARSYVIGDNLRKIDTTLTPSAARGVATQLAIQEIRSPGAPTRNDFSSTEEVYAVKFTVSEFKKGPYETSYDEVEISDVEVIGSFGSILHFDYVLEPHDSTQG